MLNLMMNVKAKMEEVMNQKGQGLTEYAVILGLVVIVCVALATTSNGEGGLFGTIQTMYTTITGKLTTLAGKI